MTGDKLPPSTTPDEVLPGMEGLLPPTPSPEAVLAAQGIVSAGIRQREFDRAARRPTTHLTTRQDEIAVEQGAKSSAIVNDRIEATGTEEPPKEKKPTNTRKRKLPLGTDGNAVSRDIANAAAKANPTKGDPMNAAARAVQAQLRMDKDRRRAAGDVGLEVAYSANRDAGRPK